MALNKIRGRRAEVTIPTLGAIVARIDAQDEGWWEISRRDDDRKEGEPPTYRLRALFTYRNPGLMKLIKDDDRYKTRFVVWLTANDKYEIKFPGSEGLALDGKVLYIEKGVTYEHID